MYSFDMTAEQKMLVDTVRRYAEKNLRSVYREAEESKHVPDPVVQLGWEIGLLPGAIDAQYGGYGDYSALTNALYLEELAWGDLGVTLHLLTPNLFAVPITQFGTDAQKEEFLARFCVESFPKATAALIEPVVQFDPAELQTTATKEGDRFALNGKKTYVPLAHTAEWFLVYAQENGVTQAFIVPGDTPGIEVGRRVKLMGVQALEFYEVEFTGVMVPKANRLGGLKGIRIQKLLTLSRLTLAALAVGMARAAYEYALTYAKGRVAFGEPIAHRQSIAFLLATMRIEIEGTRLMLWEAAYKYDAGEDASRAAYLAKNYADKMVLKVTDGAVQVLGGHGYIREHPVELWLRNGRGFVTMDGAVLA